jgi:hypothetical protein
MLKQRRKGFTRTINLRTVEKKVVRRKLAVLGNISGSARRGDSETVHHINSPKLSEKVEAKVDVRHAFKLSTG